MKKLLLFRRLFFKLILFFHIRSHNSKDNPGNEAANFTYHNLVFDSTLYQPAFTLQLSWERAINEQFSTVGTCVSVGF